MTVPLYDTLGTEAIQHIVNQTEMTMLLASRDKARDTLTNAHSAQIQSLINLKASLPALKLIISMDAVDEALIKKGAEVGLEIIGMEQFEAVRNHSCLKYSHK